MRSALLAPMLLAGCVAGVDEERYSSAVELFLGAAELDPTQPYAHPERALGPPDGRTVALGSGSALVLRFFREIPDGPGPDLRVIEIGPDGATAWVAASEDGVGFSEAATPAGAAVASGFDLAELGLRRAKFIRVRGIGNEGLDPGFDLDAVEALH